MFALAVHLSNLITEAHLHKGGVTLSKFGEISWAKRVPMAIINSVTVYEVTVKPSGAFGQCVKFA